MRRPSLRGLAGLLLLVVAGCDGGARLSTEDAAADAETAADADAAGDAAAGDASCGSSLADIMSLGCAATYTGMLAADCAANPDAYRAGRCGEFLVTSTSSIGGFSGSGLTCTYDLQGQAVGASLMLPESTPPCPTAGNPVVGTSACDVTELPNLCGADGGLNDLDDAGNPVAGTNGSP